MFLHLFGIIYSGQLQKNNYLNSIGSKSNAEVAILGCGWLGFPLAESLLSRKFKVSGSTTTPDKIKSLAHAGIEPFHIEFNPTFKGAEPEKFFNKEILIINIPPSLRKNPEGHHLAQIEELNQLILKHSVKKVIFISSTSVYPEINSTINEDYKFSEPYPELLKAENKLKNNKKIDLTIIRCGGLMGYDRIPAKYFAGKKNIPEGDRPVNYIHRDDVIEVIYRIISNNFWGEIFNLVAPAHPTKKEICEKTALDFNFIMPEFNDQKSSAFKIVEVKKIIDRLNYKFIFPDPLNFYYTT